MVNVVVDFFTLEESSLEESIITHSTEFSRLRKILDTGLVKSAYGAGGPSFSKYPQYNHGDSEDGSSKPFYIAFHRAAIENDHFLHRPLYLDVETDSGELLYKRGGRTRRTKQHTEKYGAFVLLTPMAKSAEKKGLRPEHGDYRIERELTTARPVNFKPDAVSHLGYHVDLGERELGSSVFRFNGGPRNSAQIASRGIADLIQLASEHNKPVKFSVQLHPSHKDYNDFLKSGNHKDIKDFKKSLLGQLKTELGRRGHLPDSSKKISNDVVNGMSIALGHPESTPSLKLKNSELSPSLRATAFSEEIITPDDLIRLKLNESKSSYRQGIKSTT